LAELEAQLNEVESQLQKNELKFNKFRWITYIIFIIGLVCIITGLLMLIFRRRPKKTTPAPEVIAEEKVNDKKSKKPETDKTKTETQSKNK